LQALRRPESPPQRPAPEPAHRKAGGGRRRAADDALDEAKLETFRQTLHMLHLRLELLANLPADKLEKARLQGTARELSSH